MLVCVRFNHLYGCERTRCYRYLLWLAACGSGRTLPEPSRSHALGTVCRIHCFLLSICTYPVYMPCRWALCIVRLREFVSQCTMFVHMLCTLFNGWNGRLAYCIVRIAINSTRCVANECQRDRAISVNNDANVSGGFRKVTCTIFVPIRLFGNWSLCVRKNMQDR